jgi:hypothetical protein
MTGSRPGSAAGPGRDPAIAAVDAAILLIAAVDAAILLSARWMPCSCRSAA